MNRQNLFWSIFLIALLIGNAAVNLLTSQSRYLLLPKEIGNRDFLNHLLVDTPSKRIDVLIIGASISWSSISANEVQTQLQAKYGEDVTVINLSSNWRGENLYLELLKRVFDKHEVGMVLFDPPNFTQMTGRPHPLSLYFESEFPWQGNVADGNLFNAARYKLIEFLGIFPKLQEIYIDYSLPDNPALASTNGSLVVDRWLAEGDFNPDNAVVKSFLLDDDLKSRKRPGISYLEKPVYAHDRLYLEAIVDLVQQHSTLGFLHVPMLEEFGKGTIQMNSYFKEFIVEKGLPVLGLSGSQLKLNHSFNPEMLYYDNRHMNSIGSRVMGAAIGAQLAEKLIAE